MANNTPPEPSRPAAASSSPYTPVAGYDLRRQMSTPAAFAATFATCGGSGAGHGGWPRNLGDDGGGGGCDFRGCCAPRPGAAAVGGGVGAVVSAVWAWIATGGSRRRRKVVASMSRSGSSRQYGYGHEEYAQNFDDGGAAAEPENLARSFSVRYARQAPSSDDNGARRRG